MKIFPICLKLDKKKCLVIGGGKVANRKVERLLKANAHIQLISQKCCQSIENLVQEGKIDLISNHYKKKHLQDIDLIIAASDDPRLHKKIARHAKKRNIWINVVDNQTLSSCYIPSIVDRDPIQVAISTAGSSPVLARHLRERIETLIPQNISLLADWSQSNREKIAQAFNDKKTLRKFWDWLLKSAIAEQVLNGQNELANDALQQQLSDTKNKYQQGMVSLVGAGPGNPDLLTFKALRLMQSADVVLYDRLVTQDILDLVRRDAEKIYVGKENKYHAFPQESINQLMIRLAQQGKHVVRLKGGDPFIFGRGGEELEQLCEHQIAFQVVPGITAASACASYAGIPLTHRDYAQSCLFITGHNKNDDNPIDWRALVKTDQTLVFYMGLQAARNIGDNLIQHGMPAQTPVAIIEQGSTANQKVHICNLLNIQTIIQTYQVQAPSLLIVGDVVKLHDKLKWFQPVSKQISSFYNSRIKN